MIDLSTVKLGDEVTVRGKVVSTHRPSTNGCLYVEISENCQGYVERSAIVSHATKPLVAGDRVKTLRGKVNGEVVSVSGRYAWVKWPSLDGPITEDLGTLERVDV